MLDTHPDMASRYRDMIMEKTGEQRLRMGCSMHDASRLIVRSSILADHPGITDVDMKREMFLRFYGHEFSSTGKDKVISALLECVE